MFFQCSFNHKTDIFIYIYIYKIREKRTVGPYIDKESSCHLVWRKLHCGHWGNRWMILCNPYLFTLPVTTLNSYWHFPLYWNLRSNVIAADWLLSWRWTTRVSLKQSSLSEICLFLFFFFFFFEILWPLVWINASPAVLYSPWRRFCHSSAQSPAHS